MPNEIEMFTVTKDHLTLLQRMYVGWNDCEYGAPEIDPKRPYGNSDVEQDILEILGEMKVGDHARMIHEEMETVLQIVLCTGEIKTGTFQMTSPYDSRSWQELKK